jgi:DNA-binding Lrp family transcriptional regulator
MKPFTRLSDNERCFLAATTLNASVSAKEVAERIGVREHKVRHIRDSLLKRGIIVPLYLIDTFRIGYTDFRLFLSDIAAPSKIRTAFEKLVLQHHQVYWAARMSGAYQYAITFLSKDPCEMIDFFAAVQPKPDGIYAHKTISIAGDWTVFTQNYLAPEMRSRQSISMTTRERISAPDKRDEEILETMARNPTANLAALARACGMASTTLGYRIDKLTEMKVVRGQIYLLNYQALGISVYRIMIVEKGLSISEREKLRKFMSSHPNVGALLVCTGGWDYELRFECSNPEAVEDFCQTIIDDFGAGIGSIRVSQQVKSLKRVAYPFMQETSKG